MTTWCHGAPGIGLARLGSLEMLDTPSIRQEITTALKTTGAFRVGEADHLCCGNMGRLELFLVAAGKLGQPDFMEAAYQQGTQMVMRASQRGNFAFSLRLPKGIYNPGLFIGTAGIGYQLLRLAYPDRLPSVLLWE